MEDKLKAEKNGPLLSGASLLKFFDLFNRSAPKCEIRIPDTIIFEGNVACAWLFNAKRGPNKGKVLKKKMDKIKFQVFVKQFLLRKLAISLKKEGMKCRVGLYQSQKERTKRLSHANFEAVVRGENLMLMNSKLSEVVSKGVMEAMLVINRGDTSLKKQYSIKDFLDFIKDGTATFGTSLIQQYLDRPTDSKEIYKAAYSCDLNNSPSYKFSIETNSRLISNNLPSLDRKLNCELKFMTDNFVKFYQQTHPEFVMRRAQLYFMSGLELNEEGRLANSIYFIGAQSLEVSKRRQTSTVRTELILKTSVQRFIVPVKKLKSQKFSAKLLSKLKIEKCRGEYCEIVSGETKSDEETERAQFQISLPYEVTVELISRTRLIQAEVLDRLCMVMPECRRARQNRFCNLDQLYRMVKVCQKCFMVYSLASKLLDLKMKKAADQRVAEPEDEGRLPAKREIFSQSTKSRKLKEVKPARLIHSPVQPRVASSPGMIRSTRSQMNINRLCLGFLNYESKQVESRPLIEKQAWQVFNLYSLRPASRSLDPQKQKQMKEALNSEMTSIMKNDSLNKEDLRRYLQLFFFQNNSRTVHIQSEQFYHFNNNKGLRKLEQYKLISPFHPLSQSMCLKSPPIIPLEFFWEKAGYPQIQHTSFDLRVFVMDNETAVIYTLVSGPSQGKEDSKRLVVLVHDMFDSLLEYQQIVRTLLQNTSNTNFLLFNYPGQSYTLFNPHVVQNNLYQAFLLDQLLFQLVQEGSIESDCEMSFVGIGLGGFILQTFLSYAQGSLPRLGKLLLVNSFSKVDGILSESIEKSLMIFRNSPQEMPNLPFNFFSVMVNQTPLGPERIAAKARLNPISIWGRLKLLEGIKNSNDVKQLFLRTNVQLLIMHSLKNCMVSIHEAEELALGPSDGSFGRSVFFTEGGHSALEDFPQELAQTVANHILSD